MNALVGYTGFVGGNIYAAGDMDCAYNSKNITDAFGTRPDLLIYAGLRAEKYLANHEPDKDLAQIRTAQENIERIAPKRLVLISTIDVFRDPRLKDETSAVDPDGLAAYGLHRYYLEQWVRDQYPDALIVRLPGLYGRGIKKNFIYDYIHRIPTMLTYEKMSALSSQDSIPSPKTPDTVGQDHLKENPSSYGHAESDTVCAGDPKDLRDTVNQTVVSAEGSCPHTKGSSLRDYYTDQGNGFWHVRTLSGAEQTALRGLLEEVGFSALQFTDSRSRYQFYDLSHLWDDLQIVLREGLHLWHPATEPVSAGEVYEYLTGEIFDNELNGTPADYDYRTIYADLFGEDRDKGYICRREAVLKDILRFVNGQMKAM